LRGLFSIARISAKSKEDKLQNKLRILSSPNLLWIKLRGGQDLPGKTEHMLVPILPAYVERGEETADRRVFVSRYSYCDPCPGTTDWVKGEERIRSLFH
jgi:hypothetical protein